MYNAHVREYNGSRALHVCVMRVDCGAKPSDLQIRPVISHNVKSSANQRLATHGRQSRDSPLRSIPPFWTLAALALSPTHQVLLSPPRITVTYFSTIPSDPVATIHLSRESTFTTGLGFLILYEIMTFQLGFASRATDASHTLSCYPITAVD